MRLSFAMPINKSQIQTLQLGGLHLEKYYLSHKLLYIGASRAECKKNLFTFAHEGKILNIVYRDVFSEQR